MSKEINDTLDKIMDVVNRTYFVAERENNPKKFQRWLFKVFFKIEWKPKIRHKVQMNPYDESILKKDGTPKCKKIYVLYIDGDEKLCDGCDKKVKRVASIRGITGDVWCVCQDCIKDIQTAWD